jgi:hypothetical protein
MMTLEMTDLETAQAILETASNELAYLPQPIHLDLELVSALPVAFCAASLPITRHWQDSTTRYWIPWTETFGAWVDAGGQQGIIVVKRGISAAEISHALTIGFASVLAGTCLSLQGKVAVHANAIALDDVAIAFAGNSGMGKSTLSAYCASQKASFVTDDILIVNPAGFVYPGNHRIKLYSQVSQDLGFSVAETVDYKLHFNPEQLGATLSQTMVPLRILYLLAESENGQIYSEQLSASQAVFEVLINSYYASQLLSSNPQLLDVYSRFVSQICVRKLFYPRDLVRLPDVYTFLQQEIHQL